VQAGALVRTVLDDPARQRLAVTAAEHIRPIVDPDLRLQVLDYWRRIDGTLSDQVASRI
jgi:catalase